MNEGIKKNNDLGSIMELMTKTCYYADFTYEDLQRVTIPAIELNQYVIIKDKETKAARSFVTWAWLNKETERGFIARTRLLQPDDIARTNVNDQLWIIDVVAPYNNGPATVRKAVEHLSITTNAKYAIFARRNQDGSIKRLGYIKHRRK